MMRTLAVCLLLVLQVSGNRTTIDELVDLEDGDICPKGTSSPDGSHFVGEDECQQCPAGEFNPEEEASFCEMCPAGTYAPDKGYWECFPCGKGKHSPSEGVTECEDCLPGHYQDE